MARVVAKLGEARAQAANPHQVHHIALMLHMHIHAHALVVMGEGATIFSCVCVFL